MTKRLPRALSPEDETIFLPVLSNFLSLNKETISATKRIDVAAEDAWIKLRREGRLPLVPLSTVKQFAQEYYNTEKKPGVLASRCSNIKGVTFLQDLEDPQTNPHSALILDSATRRRFLEVYTDSSCSRVELAVAFNIPPEKIVQHACAALVRELFPALPFLQRATEVWRLVNEPLKTWITRSSCGIESGLNERSWNPALFSRHRWLPVLATKSEVEELRRRGRTDLIDPDKPAEELTANLYGHGGGRTRNRSGSPRHLEKIALDVGTPLRPARPSRHFNSRRSAVTPISATPPSSSLK